MSKSYSLDAVTSKYTMSGVLFAIVFFCLSMLPSLLPRPWLYQGLIAGLSSAVGYGFGVVFAKTAKWLGFSEPDKKVRAELKRLFTIIGPIIFVLFILLGNIWQREVSELVGKTPNTSFHMVSISLITLLTFAGAVGLARSIRKLYRFVNKKIAKYVPRKISATISLIFVGLVLFWVANGVLFSTFESQSKRIYSATNSRVPDGISKPTAPERSGSDASLVKWETIGAQGQRFVSRGPSVQQLTDFSGTPAKQPIRLYAGVNSADTAKERADLVVAEMKRTGAFDRSVIVLATTTGTGWLEPQSTDSIEYMFNGDTAIVTQQYSFLPSWISFLVDTDNARQAGRALYEAVHSEWSQLPKESRPKLIAYGLSLGSFGGQSAFSSANDITRSIDGALFLGTPSATDLSAEITASRDAGSPQIKPIYQNGRSVRYASNNEDITQNQDSWQGSRVLYIQHASDPVVWFGFDLMLQRPDWLNEPRGDDVSEKTRWYPFVTFFQVAVDQFFGTSVPNGHGHNYPNTIVSAWEAVARPTEWSKDDHAKLQNIIDTYSNE